ncbi:MAG: hypothetical protein B6226_00295 [Candidatus Cloacimonetes bacterium 4572_65]|nr:MAG: hypothetical protein B6226_00295 [Candidatus Cloacimonetes bacterium 4572_65]
MKTDDYVKRIIKIILLTNIPFVVSLFFANHFWISLGYILGSVASGISFVWQAYILRSALTTSESVTKIRAIKGFYLRFAAVVLYALLVVILFRKINIVWLGIGLLAAQLSIYIDLAWGIIKKYIRIE